MTFLSPLAQPPILVALCGGLLVLIAIAVTHWGVRFEGRAIRRVLVGLRAAALALALALLFKPAWLRTSTRSEMPRVAVLVDTSGSMGLLASKAEGKTRAELVAGWLEAGAGLRGSGLETLLMSFDEEPILVGPFGDAAKSIGRSGGLTAVGQSADRAFFLSEAGQIDAVILASDGRETAEGGALVLPLDESSGRPVYPLILPIETMPDLAIRDAMLAASGSINETLRVPVVVSRTLDGPTSGAIHVEDITPGSPAASLETMPFSLNGDTPRAAITLPVTAREAGHRLLRFTASVRSEDAVAANNVLIRSVVVSDDTTRVLLLGRPSWEFHFLRRAMEADASLEVTALPLMERNWAESLAAHPGLNAGPLRADLIVLSGYLPAEVPESWTVPVLQPALDSGAGLIWTLGQPVDGNDRYTGHGELLPVDFSGDLELEPRTAIEPGPGADNQSADPLLAANEAARTFWSGLGTLGQHLTGPTTKPWARTLLRDERTQAPLVVSGQRGVSAVTMILIADLWRVAFTPDSSTQSAGAGFLRGLVRSSARPQARKLLRRLNPTGTFAPGKPFELRAAAANPDGSPDTGAVIQGTLAGPVDRDGGTLERAVSFPAPGPDGTATLRMDPLPEGVYRLTLRNELLGGQAQDVTLVQVTPARTELIDPSPDPEHLRRIARRSGGKAIEWKDRDSLAPAMELKSREITLTRRVELWDTPAAFLLFTAVLGMEWYLRKRQGLR